MKHFTNRQIIALCVLSMGFGALFSPPLKSVAQPPESQPEDGTAQDSATPQPLNRASADAGRTTNAVASITGQGTAGYISKFTGANAIGNSLLFENGGKVSIGANTGTGVFNVVSGAGVGVYGFHSGDTGGNEPGVRGDTTSNTVNAAGVIGWAKNTSPGSGSAGVRGINNGTTANGYGIYGSHAGSGAGVYATSNSGNGILGNSNYGVGVRGRHTLTTGTAPGVQGETNSTDANAIGVQGIVNSTSPGASSSAVRGTNNGTGYSGYGVYGSHAGYSAGVYGTSINGYGVQGNSTNGTAVQGTSTSNNGVYGSSSSGIGVYGYSQSNYGTYGYSYSKNGINGQSYNGNGVYGGSTNGYVGYFQGNVMITGNLAKASGSFKIDHPQHPATEYLSHSFVESPDMMNVYNGNVTTDAKGEAVVTLPKYFQSLNRDFRYQLTPIGQFAQAIVGQKIKGNRFLVRTDKPNVEVSWQVTGVRNDAYARQHRIQVEESKTGADRGRYLYPAGFGFGKNKQIGSVMPRLAKR
ncbi:hypothetical protein EON80_08355 [bacterium]|nr:MAG: hypothetical protein EON80_08355 [bacterium]